MINFSTEFPADFSIFMLYILIIFGCFFFFKRALRALNLNILEGILIFLVDAVVLGSNF